MGECLDMAKNEFENGEAICNKPRLMTELEIDTYAAMVNTLKNIYAMTQSVGDKDGEYPEDLDLHSYVEDVDLALCEVKGPNGFIWET